MQLKSFNLFVSPTDTICWEEGKLGKQPKGPASTGMLDYDESTSTLEECKESCEAMSGCRAVIFHVGECVRFSSVATSDDQLEDSTNGYYDYYAMCPTGQ